MTRKKIINKKNLVPDSSWLNFRKVRAIIENASGNIVICTEGGVPIFPGGKCDANENEENAIKREVKEETGIELTDERLNKALVIESFYDDFYDFRSKKLRPRHTVTTYFYVKTNKWINKDKIELTDGEKRLGFNIFTVSKNNLYKLLNEDHQGVLNGKFFDEENRIVLNEILKEKGH